MAVAVANGRQAIGFEINNSFATAAKVTVAAALNGKGELFRAANYSGIDVVSMAEERGCAVMSQPQHGGNFVSEWFGHRIYPVVADLADARKVEGPNIANAFKRTFYQMMFKFQVGAHGHSAGCVLAIPAGCVLAIPAAVWDSRQRHLGKPRLIPYHDGTYRLAAPRDESALPDPPPAWIYVFDVDVSTQASPNGIQIKKVIGTTAAAFSYFALEVAPEATLEEGGSVDRLLATIQIRLSEYLPEFRPARRARS